MIPALAAATIWFQTRPLAERTLLLVNADSQVSVAVGAAYAKARSIKNVVRIHCHDSAVSTANETINYAEFDKAIERPVRGYLGKHPEVDFIVLTKGVPLRIDGAPGLGISGSRLALDSYLAALDYGTKKDATKVTLTDAGFTGVAWANRFWNSNERFSHAKFGGYLVTRLDGYTQEDAERLIAYAREAERQKPSGAILLDACPSFGFSDPATEPVPAIAGTGDAARSVNELAYNHFNGDMRRAAGLLSGRKLPALLEETDAFVSRQELMGYVSWGSNDSHFDPTNYAKLRFAPGGIAETAVSTSARTFLPTTGGQSLIADLVAHRATGAKGYCDEPLLQAVASPTILFDRYTRGWTLAESYFAASRFVGWEDIVVGDPLCRPYK